MKKYFVLIALLLLAVILTSCAAGPNPELKTLDENGKIAGFWTGLWQGVVAPYTFIISRSYLRIIRFKSLKESTLLAI